MTPTFLNYAWNCNYKHTTFHHIKLTTWYITSYTAMQKKPRPVQWRTFTKKIYPHSLGVATQQ